MHDVVIVGGGVIGLSVAWELAGQGVSVRVLERGDFGREASWAGAGILPPGRQAAASHPEAALRAHSHQLWPAWTQQLHDLTGIDNGFRQCGGLEVRVTGDPDQLDNETAVWESEGVVIERLSCTAARLLEPALTPDVVAAYRLPDLCQVRNPRHLKALQSGCLARGVELSSGQPVTDIETDGDRVVAVRTTDGRVSAGRFCIAGGAWSRQILETVGIDVSVFPVRGQIVQLSGLPLAFQHVLQCGPRYLVPRPDGRILIGSTEEHVGFEKQTTADAIAGLIDFARHLVPQLGRLRFERAWSGLRPGTNSDLPILGRPGSFENLFVATGHFRSGLQMSPGTAVVLRQYILDQEPCLAEQIFIDRRASCIMDRNDD